MGKRTSYSPGTFSWVDLGTTDAAAAKSFYSSLFGWVIEEAFDVLDVGRTAVIEDPQGAVLALWQPGTRIGAERVNDVGCLCMNELATTDMRAAGAFYERLFGWTVEISDDAPEGPAMIFNGGDVNGALFAAPEGAAPHWRPCFNRRVHRRCPGASARARRAAARGAVGRRPRKHRDGARPAGRPVHDLRRRGGPVTPLPGAGDDRGALELSCACVSRVAWASRGRRRVVSLRGGPARR